LRAAGLRGQTLTTRDLLETLFEAWQAHDALRSAACFAPDAVYCEAGGVEVVGRNAISAHFAHFFREGPPWRFEVDEVFGEGDRVAVAYRFGLKGAGDAWIDRSGCAIVALEGGLVARWREYHG
jgi:uncharacterized protein (TIGR02246 family)